MTRIRAKAVAACAVVTVLGSAVPAQAAKLAKPAQPTIVGIQRISTSGKFGDYRIFIDSTSVLSKSMTTEITSDLKKSCKIKSPSNSCVVKKLKINSYYRFKARSKNKAGFSKWSKSVQLMANSAGFVRKGYDSNGKKFPAAFASTTYRWKTLGATSKWTKFQALKRSGISSAASRPRLRPRITSCGQWSPMPTTTTVPAAPAGEPCVVFNVDGVVGLATTVGNSTCGSSASCALAVSRDGSTTSLFATGSDTPSIKDFYSAPNGKLYVVFLSPTRLVTAGPQCVFVEVNVESGIPTCVDTEIMNVQTTFGNMYGLSNNGNPPVQFDNAGNVYYLGTVTGAVMQSILRVYSNGSVRSIVSDNISIRDFIVLGDGNVLISGTTTSTNANWIRNYTPSGGLKNLITGSMPTFSRVFADGNAYFGIQTNNGSPKIMRYQMGKSAIDAAPWIGSTIFKPTATEPAPTLDRSIICPSNGSAGGSFCMNSGVYSLNFFNFGSTRTLGIAGSPGGNGGTQLVQYWPTLELENTIVSNITIAYRINNMLLITGTDASGKNILTMYDPETNQEQIILDGSNEVEIYSFAYVPSTNKLMFNGLQFSDNKYVVAEVALP